VIAGVVLAAGAATRFGSPKQLLRLGDVLERLSASPVDEIVVVAGAYDLSSRVPQKPRLRIVHCPEWERGPGASLRCGLSALPLETEAAVVVLADGPNLAPGAVTRVIEAWGGEGASVVAASYGGVRGHPLLLARSAWAAVPDEGLRVRAPRLVPCDDLGAPGDVDYEADLPPRLRPR
jgi:CTP:molybdopterin cytidylyltransferase MocA